MRKRVLAALAWALLAVAAAASAQEFRPFVVKDIRVEECSAPIPGPSSATCR
jgi:hypothetical protein